MHESAHVQIQTPAYTTQATRADSRRRKSAKAITEWPLVLDDLATDEGVTGRAYLEPYIVKPMRCGSRPLFPDDADIVGMGRSLRLAAPPGEPHAAFAADLHPDALHPGSGTAACRGDVEGGLWTSMSALYVPAPQIFLNVRFA